MGSLTAKETVCLDPTLARELDTASRKSLASKSTIMRQALSAWLDAHGWRDTTPDRDGLVASARGDEVMTR